MTFAHRQVATLRRALERRRAALARELHGDAEKARTQPYAELAGSTHDSGDESVADLITDVTNAELSRDLRELREVEAALLRITHGQYGACADCALDIPFERLQAEPAALRCLACQERRERGK